MNYIQVYLAQNEMEASIIKGLLESFGVESMVNRVSSGASVPGYLEGSGSGVYEVCVKQEDAEKARKIIEERE